MDPTTKTSVKPTTKTPPKPSSTRPLSTTPSSSMNSVTPGTRPDPRQVTHIQFDVPSIEIVQDGLMSALGRLARILTIIAMKDNDTPAAESVTVGSEERYKSDPAHLIEIVMRQLMNIHVFLENPHVTPIPVVKQVMERSLKEAGVVFYPDPEEAKEQAGASQTNAQKTKAGKYGDYHMYGEEVAPGSSLTMNDSGVQSSFTNNQRGSREHEACIEESQVQDDTITPSSPGQSESSTSVQSPEVFVHKKKYPSLTSVINAHIGNQRPSAPRPGSRSPPSDPQDNKNNNRSTDNRHPGNNIRNPSEANNRTTLQDDDLSLVPEFYDDLRTFENSISGLTDVGRRRLAQIMPAMDNLKVEDWTRFSVDL
ncbi:hypothetical protein V8F20_003112 [Naviculisporaceae sp. PSN 640]